MQTKLVSYILLFKQIVFVVVKELLETALFSFSNNYN